MKIIPALYLLIFIVINYISSRIRTGTNIQIFLKTESEPKNY